MRRVAPDIAILALDSIVQCPGIAPGASAPVGAPALTVQNVSRSLAMAAGQACPSVETIIHFRQRIFGSIPR